MSYVIKFLKEDRVVGSMTWDGDIKSAITHARDQFPIWRKTNGATLVVVVDDDDNETVFTFGDEKCV
jgi:hypothetical protein